MVVLTSEYDIGSAQGFVELTSHCGLLPVLGGRG